MKPSIPAGTRDFNAEVVRKRQHILNTIRKIFEVYGFEPLETPAIENIDTLTGKYGEEGDKLIFRILDSGNPFSANFFRGFSQCLKDYHDSIEEFNEIHGGTENAFKNPLWRLNPEVLEGISQSLLTDKRYKHYLTKLKYEISNKALKYDLTIPFARYVATNHGQLTFPFKRYQIQPVWRADRPQKGRYREFYQCDADVVGSNSHLSEIDFINIYHDLFTQLQITGFRLLINNRKILKGILETCGVEQQEKEILVIIDKTDKIGVNGVKEELLKINIPEEKLQKLIEVYSFKGTNSDTLNFLKKFLIQSTTGIKGVEELEIIIKYLNNEQLSNLLIDLTLARGLEYYTGIIFEVRAPGEVKIGSIGGGGRYDDLTGLFGVPGIPGVGISFGVDRIYDVMEELNLFPETIEQGTKILFFNLGETESKTAYRFLMKIRKSGIPAEIYHEPAKLDKQFKYAEKKNIPFVIREIKEKDCSVKNIRTGEQFNISLEDLVQKAALL